MTRRDGMAGDLVRAILQDRNGDLWFGMSGGVTRYRPPTQSSPPVSIDAVVADRRYENVAELSISSSVRITAFEFHGMSFKTRPEQMVYRYRLKGYDEDWRTTHARRMEYQDLPLGTYTFEVQAVDRDLVYSKMPATVTLRVHPPYTLIGLVSALGIAVALIVYQAGRIVQRDRRLQESNRELQRDRTVERVRAEIATMRASADLERITSLIWKELREVGVPFFRCGVFIVDEEEKCVRSYLTNPHGVPLAALSLAFDSHPHTGNIVDHWRAGEIYVEQWDRQAFLNWMQFLQTQGQQIERERYLDAEAPPESLTLQFVPFTHGMLYVGSASSLPEEDVNMVKGLANAFSVAYARYLDFQKLEAQNRQLAEANEQLQELDQIKTDFFSNVSHELRTPMTAIKGRVDNLLDGIAGPLSDQQAYYLARVRANADRLTRLINNLLDLSRIDRGETDLLHLNVERLSVREVVSEAVESLRPVAEEAGLRLTFDGVDAYGMADKDRLVQIVTNLVGNAIKFTSAGREVRVKVELDGAGYVRTVVQDMGRGIPAGELDRIFDRFHQVKGTRGGAGLGLPITKELAELQGGEIRVESQVGVGSTFTFTLPVAKGE